MIIQFAMTNRQSVDRQSTIDNSITNRQSVDRQSAIDNPIANRQSVDRHSAIPSPIGNRQPAIDNSATLRGIVRAPHMEPRDLERIAKGVLRELGAGDPPVTVSAADGGHDSWRILVGGHDPLTLTIRAGAGTTANYVREQIFAQFSRR